MPSDAPLTPTLADEIEAVRRHICRLEQWVVLPILYYYEKADRAANIKELAAMRAVLATLTRLQEHTDAAAAL